MDQAQPTMDAAQLRVRNVGGIDRTTVELGPGVTVLAGRNATNRTSLLQAIMAACGSENVSLKADADEGDVELTVGDAAYTRRLVRRDGGVATSGDPYLDDPTVADLFAFLLESNEARRAVARRGDLREIIMRPVDTEAIEADIDRLESERDDLDAELDELRTLAQRLPDLEEERARIEERIHDKREALEAKKREIDALDADLEDTREEQAALDEALDELSAVRGELEDVRYDVDTERKSIEALREERAELEADLDAYSGVSEDRMDEIADEIQRLRGQLQAIDATANELQSVIQFNEDVLDGDRSRVVRGLASEDDDTNDGSVTDRLLDDGEVVCWTCGSSVSADRIDATLDRLRDLRDGKIEERRRLRDDIDELENERIEIEERRRQREEILASLERIEDELADRESRLGDLEDRREALADEVGALEDEIEALQTEEYGAILDHHRDANQLEFELDRLHDEVDAVEDEIATVEDRLGERDRLESRRGEIQTEIEELRTRIERLEEEAIDRFNDHMATVLDLLDYRNLERIWIERTEREVRDGRRTVSRGQFDLHVVRSTDSGAVYEDTVEHLSESEREVTGLVFALAGYLVHEVHRKCPFMLLDSVEALDAERIARVVDYLDGYADYLVVALLPEDAATLDDDYRRVTEI